jgi:hypothetical protein
MIGQGRQLRPSSFYQWPQPCLGQTLLLFLGSSFLRGEYLKKIDEAKKDAESLLSSGKLGPETGAVIKSLILVIDIIVVVLLEKKTRKNSSNSGLPPSKNYDQTRLKSAKIAERSIKARSQKEWMESLSMGMQSRQW